MRRINTGLNAFIKIFSILVFCSGYCALLGYIVGYGKGRDKDSANNTGTYYQHEGEVNGAIIGATIPLLVFCMGLAVGCSIQAYRSGANERTSPPSGSTDETTTDEGVWSKCTRGLRNLPSLFSGGPERPNVHEEQYPTEDTGDSDQSLLTTAQQP